MAGETPASASVTAEAGKLPTLNVRPFWPFQVAESGLWEEALVEGVQWGLGLGPHSARELCATELHLPEGSEAFFSRTQKGSMGLVAPAGGHNGSRSLQAREKEGTQRTRVQGAGEQEIGTRVRKVGWESSSWGHVGGMRLSPALDDGDGVASLHP